MTFHGSLISGARISGSPFYGAGITYGREDVAVFSPASLFASGEVGAWYDPSDLTTLFQDEGGTQPVTAPGQTVALMRDKSGRGNHATQAITARRPTYAVVPRGGRRNLLLNTTTLATQSVTVTNAAHTLSFTGTGTVTLSGASTAGPLAGTGANDRVSLTFTPSAGSLTLTVSGSVTLAQLETGSAATAYQRVGTQFDVTEAGVASKSYLRFDGVDDGMLTASFSWPGLYSVWTGIQPGRVTGVQTIANMDPGAGGSRLPQFIRISSSTPESIGFVGGTPFGDLGPAVAANTNYVLSVNTLGSQINVRTNTVSNSVTSFTGSLSTASNVLAVGRFDPVFPGNYYLGNIYSLIVRGAASDAATITSTETWVNSKTGAY